jgi:hypothetical protein
MKNQKLSNHLALLSLAVVLALGILTPLQAQSTMPMKDKSIVDGKAAVQDSAKGMMMDGQKREAHQMMTQRHETMMAEMNAQNTELAAQVATMNSAPAAKKMDLLAAIVTRMVEQRTVMNTRMGMMQGEMMGPMSAMPLGASSSMQPPMMKGMAGKKEGTEN